MSSSDKSILFIRNRTRRILNSIADKSIEKDFTSKSDNPIGEIVDNTEQNISKSTNTSNNQEIEPAKTIQTNEFINPKVEEDDELFNIYIHDIKLEELRHNIEIIFNRVEKDESLYGDSATAKFLTKDEIKLFRHEKNKMSSLIKQLNKLSNKDLSKAYIEEIKNILEGHIDQRALPANNNKTEGKVNKDEENQGYPIRSLNNMLEKLTPNDINIYFGRIEKIIRRESHNISLHELQEIDNYLLALERKIESENYELNLEEFEKKIESTFYAVSTLLKNISKSFLITFFVYRGITKGSLNLSEMWEKKLLKSLKYFIDEEDIIPDSSSDLRGYIDDIYALKQCYANMRKATKDKILAFMKKEVSKK